MVNPLSSVLAKYAAAKDGHDVKLTAMQRLKVAAHFVHSGGQKMKAVYDQAQAKKDAREAVYAATRDPERDNPVSCVQRSRPYGLHPHPGHRPRSKRPGNETPKAGVS